MMAPRLRASMAGSTMRVMYVVERMLICSRFSICAAKPTKENRGEVKLFQASWSENKGLRRVCTCSALMSLKYSAWSYELAQGTTTATSGEPVDKGKKRRLRRCQAKDKRRTGRRC